MPKITNRPKTYVLILNWNGWKDTVECLETVFRLDYPHYQVIVCDNGSTDGSWDRIREWAAGKLVIDTLSSPLQCRLCSSPITRPTSYTIYSRIEAENGGRFDDRESQLILIQTGANLGFAGGNNVGLRYVLARDDAEYIWLLNSDTLVEPDSLTKLVDHMAANPSAGMCGSTLRYADDPYLIQAMGGARYYPWIGTGKHVGVHQPYEDLQKLLPEAKSIDYVVGASMLVRSSFVRSIGLMSERYFLYYEELDWAIRAKKHFTLAYAPESTIYHKEGGSIGSSSKAAQRSTLAEYYMLRNRILLTKQYFMKHLWLIRAGYLVVLFNRLRRGQITRLRTIWAAIVDGERNCDQQAIHIP